MKSRGWFKWGIITDNASYKIVAFIVAMVLWFTMLGRRDVVMTEEFRMQVLLPPNMTIQNEIPESIKVEVSGPRIALRKLAENPVPFTVDLGSVQRGRQIVRLSKEGLRLPLGTKVISMHPSEFLAVVTSETPSSHKKSDRATRSRRKR